MTDAELLPEHHSYTAVCVALAADRWPSAAEVQQRLAAAPWPVRAAEAGCAGCMSWPDRPAPAAPSLLRLAAAVGRFWSA